MTVHILTNVNKVTENYNHYLYIWIINYKMIIALAVFNWLQTHLQWKKVKPGGGDRISWIIHPDLDGFMTSVCSNFCEIPIKHYILTRWLLWQKLIFVIQFSSIRQLPDYNLFLLVLLTSCIIIMISGIIDPILSKQAIHW